MQIAKLGAAVRIYPDAAGCLGFSRDTSHDTSRGLDWSCAFYSTQQLVTDKITARRPCRGTVNGTVRDETMPPQGATIPPQDETIPPRDGTIPL